MLGLDGFDVHGIGQREAATERPVRALHTQILVFVDLLLELALTPHGENVVLDADVELLGLDIWKIRFHNQGLLGLININGGSPRGEAAFAQRAIKGRVKEAIDLVLERNSTKRFKSANFSFHCSFLHELW